MSFKEVAYWEYTDSLAIPEELKRELTDVFKIHYHKSEEGRISPPTISTSRPFNYSQLAYHYHSQGAQYLYIRDGSFVFESTRQNFCYD